MSGGQLYVISAPSGAGKTSLVKRLLETVSDLVVSVSYTTRKPRTGEVDGQDYHFISQEDYDYKVAAHTFVEYARVFDYGYGTSEKDLIHELTAGNDVVLEIDWQGARQIRAAFPQCVSIFILPPSRKTLECRLKERGQDDQSIIDKRMAKAVAEMEHYNEFDYLIINDQFDEAYHQLESVVLAERIRVERQTKEHQKLIQELLHS